MPFLSFPLSGASLRPHVSSLIRALEISCRLYFSGISTTYLRGLPANSEASPFSLRPIRRRLHTGGGLRPRALALALFSPRPPFSAYLFSFLFSHSPLRSRVELSQHWKLVTCNNRGTCISTDALTPQSAPEALNNGSMTSELQPFAQLQLLKALVEVKMNPRQPAGQPVAEQMDMLTTELFWTTPDPQICRLENLGVFLTQILGVIAQLATSLAHGPHISTYTERYIREAAQRDDFTDMSIVTFLDTKHTLLKYY